MSHERSVRALDKYWDTLVALFWPRLQRIIQMNVQSVRDCDPQRLKVLDLRPHYVTRRYAELAAAFISVNEMSGTAGGGAMATASASSAELLQGLQQEIEHLILRMASIFPQRREQIIFIINNYDVILSVIGVSIFHIQFYDFSLFLLLISPLNFIFSSFLLIIKSLFFMKVG